MSNKNQLYSIYLPNPNPLPHQTSEAIAYVGTQDEILSFARRLARTPQASHYYKFLDPICKNTADPSTWSFCAPVTEIGRKEYCLSDHKWTYLSPFTECEYLMRADWIWINYLLAETRNGLMRFDKVMFENLTLSMPGVGWVAPDVLSGGTPGMTYVEKESDGSQTVHMSLSRCGKTYYPRHRTPSAALADLPGLLSVRLNPVLAEVVGQL